MRFLSIGVALCATIALGKEFQGAHLESGLLGAAAGIPDAEHYSFQTFAPEGPKIEAAPAQLLTTESGLNMAELSTQIAMVLDMTGMATQAKPCPIPYAKFPVEKGKCRFVNSGKKIPVPSAEDNTGWFTTNGWNYSGNVEPSYEMLENRAYSLGNSSIVFTMHDDYENRETCTTTIEVVDNEAPTFTFRSLTGSLCGVTLTPHVNDPDKCGSTMKWEVPSAADNCPGATAIAPPAVHTGHFFPVNAAPHVVQYEAIDTSLNKKICTIKFDVKDITKPKLNCKSASLELPTSAANCKAKLKHDVQCDYSDNCQGGAYTCNHHEFGPGTTNVTCTATDLAGLRTVVQTSVTVKDTKSPEVRNCPSNIVKTLVDGQKTEIAVWTPPVADDNSCEDIKCNEIHGYKPGDSFAAGDHTISYSCSDSSGNSATCAFSLKVDGKVKFTKCPVAVTAIAHMHSSEAPVSFELAAVNSEGKNAIISPDGVSLLSGMAFPVGKTSVSFTAKDVDSAATAKCSFTVDVRLEGKPEGPSGGENVCPERMTVESSKIGAATWHQCGGFVATTSGPAENYTITSVAEKIFHGCCKPSDVCVGTSLYKRCEPGTNIPTSKPTLQPTTKDPTSFPTPTIPTPEPTNKDISNDHKGPETVAHSPTGKPSVAAPTAQPPSPTALPTAPINDPSQTKFPTPKAAGGDNNKNTTNTTPTAEPTATAVIDGGGGTSSIPDVATGSPTERPDPTSKPTASPTSAKDVDDTHLQTLPPSTPTTNKPTPQPTTTIVQWDIQFKWSGANSCERGLHQWINEEVKNTWMGILAKHKVQFNRLNLTAETSCPSGSSGTSSRGGDNAVTDSFAPVTRIMLAVPETSITRFQESPICYALCQPRMVRESDRIWQPENRLKVRYGEPGVQMVPTYCPAAACAFFTPAPGSGSTNQAVETSNRSDSTKSGSIQSDMFTVILGVCVFILLMCCCFCACCCFGGKKKSEAEEEDDDDFRPYRFRNVEAGPSLWSGISEVDKEEEEDAGAEEFVPEQEPPHAPLPPAVMQSDDYDGEYHGRLDRDVLLDNSDDEDVHYAQDINLGDYKAGAYEEVVEGTVTTTTTTNEQTATQHRDKKDEMQTEKSDFVSPPNDDGSSSHPSEIILDNSDDEVDAPALPSAHIEGDSKDTVEINDEEIPEVVI
eukprot:jgi/Bigna1/86373/estExt_fgenesh1_pg.C_100063